MKKAITIIATIRANKVSDTFGKKFWIILGVKRDIKMLQSCALQRGLNDTKSWTHFDWFLFQMISIGSSGR